MNMNVDQLSKATKTQVEAQLHTCPTSQRRHCSA